MAVTLIVNPGSSSKKYTLLRDGRLLVTYYFERVGSGFELSCEEATGRVTKSTLTALGYQQALTHVIGDATQKQCIADAGVITRVGVRIVAPGTYFTEHRIIDDEYIQRLRAVTTVAPLHIPHIIEDIKAIGLALPTALLIGVSDSAFHTTMPHEAKRFSVSRADAEAYDLYRFGYHGLSVSSVVRQSPQVLGRLPERMVVCHIGSGMSMTAVKAGQSLDTTMGFAPGSGLFMGARTGDVEPAVVLEIMRQKNLSIVDMQQYLQSTGGFVGQVGEADFRHLLARLERGDEAVAAAFRQCVYQFQKTLGAYAVALGGLDAVVFTATAVERSSRMRELFCENLSMLNVSLDEGRNDDLVGRSGIVSLPDAPVTVAVIRTAELEELARITDTF